MVDAGVGLPVALTDAGFWIGLLLTLLIFSLALGDNALARLAQHLLVGASLGYAALLAIESVISPRLLAPLAQGQWMVQGAPLLLGLLLLAAGVERLAAQGRPSTTPGAARKALQVAGVIPIAILLGVGIAAGLLGVLQGTILPQSLVAMVGGAGANGAQALWVGLLTLLLTTATLLHLTLERSKQIDPLPRPLRATLLLWAWIGERALWIVSGIILARLFAARLSLLVARLDYLAATLQATGLWQWFERIWSNLIS